jgi:CRP-like cAMP-binding protein
MYNGLTMEQIINFLLDAPMFGDLDPHELSQIVHIMQVQRLREGQHVFHEGDPGDAWYVVFGGEVEVLIRSAAGSPRRVATLGAGTCFGEMAILDSSSRSATVRTLDAVIAFRFPRIEFNELIASGNLAAYKLVYQMARVLVSRQRRTTQRLVALYDNPRPTHVRQHIEPIIDQSSVAE